MMDYLLEPIRQAVNTLNKNLIYELRIRANAPVKINFQGEYRYLTKTGVSKFAHNAIRINEKEINEIVANACQGSIYAVNEELKQGFITTVNGERIGLAGTFVMQGQEVISVRDITSLCIRIPHFVAGCADQVLKTCFVNPSSVLLLSSPGMGKTTFLKAILRFLSESNNVFVVDERGELYEQNTLADVIRFSNKRTAFICGLRALRPDYVITDELIQEDYVAVKGMIESGVHVIASAHLTDRNLVPLNIFDYYVLLSSHQIGVVKEIVKKDGTKVYG